MKSVHGILKCDHCLQRRKIRDFSVDLELGCKRAGEKVNIKIAFGSFTLYTVVTSRLQFPFCL